MQVVNLVLLFLTSCDIGLFEQRVSTAVPQLVFKLLFTFDFGHLLGIHENGVEVWVVATDVHHLVDSVKHLKTVIGVQSERLIHDYWSRRRSSDILATCSTNQRYKYR